MEKNDRGKWGEQKAANYLRLRGYRILDMNYRCRCGEIDIIAQKRGFIVFAEVKLRKSSAYGEAKEFVNRAKQERIITTAQIWLSQHETELQPRFDVIEMYAPDSEIGRVKINHIENAFGE